MTKKEEEKKEAVTDAPSEAKAAPAPMNAPARTVDTSGKEGERKNTLDDEPVRSDKQIKEIQAEEQKDPKVHVNPSDATENVIKQPETDPRVAEAGVTEEGAVPVKEKLPVQYPDPVTHAEDPRWDGKPIEHPDADSVRGGVNDNQPKAIPK